MNLVTLLYLVASVCFIQALKGLSSPGTARRGNAFGMTGMAIAAVTTLVLIIKLKNEFLAAGAAQLVLEGGPVGQQFLRTLEAALAVLGELHAVRGAPQQAQAERTLERLQAPAHRGLAHAELAGGGREAAGLDDADEGLHQLDAVGRGGAGGGCGTGEVRWSGEVGHGMDSAPCMHLAYIRSSSPGTTV